MSEGVTVMEQSCQVSEMAVFKKKKQRKWESRSEQAQSSAPVLAKELPASRMRALGTNFVPEKYQLPFTFSCPYCVIRNLVTEEQGLFFFLFVCFAEGQKLVNGLLRLVVKN